MNGMGNIEHWIGHPAIASMREAVMRAGIFGTAAAFEALHEDGFEVVRITDTQGAVSDRDALAQVLAHVINRVSTEGRDDEHGHIFAAGKAALDHYGGQ